MRSFFGDRFKWQEKNNFWLLGYLKRLYHGYENVPLHPLALISLFVLGLSSMLPPGHTGVPDTAIQQVLFFDGNRLGLLDLNTIKSKKKKNPHTMDMGWNPYFAEMPFGIFPDFVKEDDRICIFSGCEKIYVCRPIEKSKGEDDGEHLSILGECYIDGSTDFYNIPKDLPATDFIFH
jgi:hypothetical protein